MAKEQKFVCPKCRSAVTRRCELVHEQARSIVQGPRYTTIRISAIADRVSPPLPPGPPDPWQLTDLVVVTALGVVAVAGVAILTKASFGLLVLLAVSGAMFGWLGSKMPRARKTEQHEQDLREFEEAMALYKRLWFCHDCGHIFKP